MKMNLRILSAAAMMVIGSSTIASANTVELTLTVPLKITMPDSASNSPVVTGADRRLQPFDVNCVVGNGLGYATGAGAQGTIIGQGSTALSGSKNIQSVTGLTLTNPTATVIITYDDGSNPGAQNTGSSAAKTPQQYLCWVAWKNPIPSLPPLFIQGALTK